MTVEEAYAMAAHATSPWAEAPFVPDAQEGDSAESIERCLSCPLKECRYNSSTRSCPMMGGKRDVAGLCPKPLSAVERRVAELAKNGTRNLLIRQMMGITPRELKRAKERLKRRGLL